MSDETDFLEEAGKKIKRFLGRSSESDKEKLSEARKQVLEGDASEEIIPELTRDLNANQKEIAGFVYYELIESGLSYLMPHEEALDKGYFTRSTNSLMYLMRFGMTKFAEVAEARLEKSMQNFRAADQVARDFDLGENAVKFSEKQINRIEKRLEIYNEIIKISNSVTEIEKPVDFEGGMLGVGKNLEKPEKLEDYGIEHIMLLRDKIFKERGKVDPYSLDRKSTKINFANPRQMLPALINEGSDAEVKKLEELMAKRREELGDKKEKLDHLTEKLGSMSAWGLMIEEKKEIEKYSF